MSVRKLLTYNTRINYANNRTKSLKVGFPKEIGQILEIGAGDRLEWCVNLVDGEIVITVKKFSE